MTSKHTIKLLHTIWSLLHSVKKHGLQHITLRGTILMLVPHNVLGTYPLISCTVCHHNAFSLWLMSPGMQGQQRWVESEGGLGHD